MNTEAAARDLEIFLLSPNIPKDGPCGKPHLVYMIEQISTNKDFSAGKKNRWLGFIQGALVALNVCTLEEMKETNKNHI